MTIDEFMRDIAPKMRPGWVAMDEDKSWCHYPYEPTIELYSGIWECNCAVITSLDVFNIASVDDWTKSLRKVGG